MSLNRTVLPGVLTCLLFILPAWSQEQSITQMEERANEILKMNNVAARRHVEEIMQLAERLAKDENLTKAVLYYEEGLRLYPLDLKRQLDCAKLYISLGKKVKAMSKARIVAELAERDILRIPAKEMLGEKVDTEVKDLGTLDGNHPIIVLVPMGEVDVLLLRDVCQKLQEHLGIKVLIRKIPLVMPVFRRDRYDDFCQSLHKRLMSVKERSPDGFAEILRQAGFKESDLDKNEKIVELFKWLQDQFNDKKAGERFAVRLAYISSEGKQWHAHDLLKVFRKVIEPYKQPKVRFIGVTRCDIYGDNTSFLLANGYLGEFMVISYRRFLSSFHQETINRNRLLKRTVTLALSSCGKVFGIDNCSDPTCPRAYPHSVAEHDAKSERLCEKCQQAFGEVFERK